MRRLDESVSVLALAVGGGLTKPPAFDGEPEKPAAVLPEGGAAPGAVDGGGTGGPAPAEGAAAAAPAAGAALDAAPDQTGHMAERSLLEGVAPPAAAEAPRPDGAAAPDKPGEAPAAAAAAAKPAGKEPAADAAAGGAKPDAAAKPAADAAAKPAADAAKPDAAAAAAPAATAPLKVEDFKLPDGFKAEGETLPQFVGIMNNAELAPAARAQQLIDLHAGLLQQHHDRVVADVAAEQHRVFGETRASWRKDIMADPILGGAGHRTAMGAVARMRDLLVPADMRAPRVWDKASAEAALKGQAPEKIAALIGRPRLSALDEFLRVTGAGDHPVFAHILHGAARYFDEPAPPPPGARPPPDVGRRPRAGAAGKAALLYTHPTSQRHR